MSEKRTPTCRDIRDAFSVGDLVYVLDDDGRYVPHRIREIGKKGFLTDIGVVLYEDHGWLWRALPVKGKVGTDVKPPDLKPCCYCGAEKAYKVATTDYVEIMCCGCGATVKEYGKTRRYDSIANCIRYVMPKAIEAWNRRANDANA